MEQIKPLLRQLIRFPIRLYQLLLRPIMKPSCKFYPSCSDYALSALESFGIAKAITMTCCRLLRCHPWSQGGYDPVISNQEKPNG